MPGCAQEELLPSASSASHTYVPARIFDLLK